MTNIWTAVQDDMGRALHASVAKHEGGMATNWVLLAETIGPDGTRGVVALQSTDLKPYEALGLLEYTRMRWAASIARGGDTEDE